MADTAITLDGRHALEVHADLTAQVAFDDILALLDRMDDLRKLGFRQILRADAGIDLGHGQDLLRVGRTDAVNITQRDIDALVRRNFNTMIRAIDT